MEQDRGISKAANDTYLALKVNQMKVFQETQSEATKDSNMALWPS